MNFDRRLHQAMRAFAIVVFVQVAILAAKGEWADVATFIPPVALAAGFIIFDFRSGKVYRW